MCELKEQLDDAVHKLQQTQAALRNQEPLCQEMKKEIANLKYENKRLGFEGKEKQEKMLGEYQSQFAALKQSIVVLKQQLDAERDGAVKNKKVLADLKNEL